MMSSIRFLFILLSLTVTCAFSEQEKLSAYDVLQQYGFPVGLLPKGVTGYALNRETGQFAAYLDGTCSFAIQSYTLKYKSTITGVISNGRLSKLKGVSVKVLLLWLNIVEVILHGDELEFSVGIASANFGVSNFVDSPQCGCGFNCSNLALNVNTALTAYEVLQQYDFPVGLLPKGVVGYVLDSTTGQFKVFLNDTCTFKIQSYDLKYKTTISGVITKDKISNLKGIEVKVLILWLNIVSVTRDGDELQFSVGIASADFAVNNFYDSPACGCGFDCVSEIRNHKNMPHDFVLSS